MFQKNESEHLSSCFGALFLFNKINENVVLTTLQRTMFILFNICDKSINLTSNNDIVLLKACGLILGAIFAIGDNVFRHKQPTLRVLVMLK